MVQVLLSQFDALSGSFVSQIQSKIVTLFTHTHTRGYMGVGLRTYDIVRWLDQEEGVPGHQYDHHGLSFWS